MKVRILALALMVAGGTTSASPLSLSAHVPAQLHASKLAASSQAPDPAQQLEQWARLFRNDDIVGLAEAILPETRWEQAKAAYELAKLKEIDEHDRAEFAEKIARVTGPDAVDKLMADLEPKIDEARQQVPGAILMAARAIQMAANSPESDLTEAQREALRAAAPGIQAWMESTDFTDTATLRQALTLITDAARGANIREIDDVRKLTLEGVLDRAGPVLAATKRAALLYGLDLNHMADSLRVEVVERDADTAKVRTTVDVFGAPVSIEHELELVDGRWFGKEMARNFRSIEVARVDIETEG